MAKYIEVQATVDRLPDSIGDRLITTKEDLLWDLDKRTQDLLASLSTSNRHTARYYSVMEELLKSFRARVRKTILPNRLEDWWFYSYEISYQGIGLFLEHMGSAFINEENGQSSSETIDQIFPLIFIPAKMLSVDEYAKLYEVEQVTVRQWIRRCKLRTVEKAGKEWRISELTDVPKRGFEPAQYRWRAELTDLPVGFEFLNDYIMATLVKSDSGDAFKVLFTDGTGVQSKTRAMELTNEEREKLESYFIANHDVSYASEGYSYWWKKKEPEPDDVEEEDDE